MSKASEHAQDLAEFMFFDDTGTVFTGMTNLQQVLDATAKRASPTFTGITTVDNIQITNGGAVTSGNFIFQTATTFQHDINQTSGSVDFSGDGITFQSGQDFILHADMKVNQNILHKSTSTQNFESGAAIDFANATISNFPSVPSSSLPDWVEAYKNTSLPNSGINVDPTVDYSLLKGKEVLILMMDMDGNTSSVSTTLTYFPDVVLATGDRYEYGLYRNDNGSHYYYYEKTAGSGFFHTTDEMSVVLVLTRDPIVYPKGGIAFELTTPVSWSN